MAKTISDEPQATESFKAVSLSKIAEAFSCAHYYADHSIVAADRARFRHIAKLIWDACGEQKPMPETLPNNLLLLVNKREGL